MGGPELFPLGNLPLQTKIEPEKKRGGRREWKKREAARNMHLIWFFRVVSSIASSHHKSNHYSEFDTSLLLEYAILPFLLCYCASEESLARSRGLESP